MRLKNEAFSIHPLPTEENKQNNVLILYPLHESGALYRGVHFAKVRALEIQASSFITIRQAHRNMSSRVIKQSKIKKEIHHQKRTPVWC